MASKYSVEAAHVLNLYLWEQISDEDTLSKYWKSIPNFGIPIIPAQQQPEVTESGYNYITYMYSDQPTKDLYAHQGQDLSWSLFSPSAGAISATIALCRDLFGEWDISARAVNAWLRDADLPAGYEEFYQRYRFMTMQLTGSDSSQPATDEAGTKDGLVTITYSFVEIN